MKIYCFSLFILFTLQYSIIIGQKNLRFTSQSLTDKSEYIVIQDISGKTVGEGRLHLVNLLKKQGYNVVNTIKPNKTHKNFPDNLIANPELAIYLFMNISESEEWFNVVSLKIKDYNNNNLFYSVEGAMMLPRAIKLALKANNIVDKLNDVENHDENLNFSKMSETQIKNYLDSNNVDEVCGIYDYTGSLGEYRIFLNYEKDKYVGYALSSSDRFKKGEIKCTLEKSAVGNIYTIHWKNSNGTETKTIAEYEYGVFKFLKTNYLYLMYPINNNVGLVKKKQTEKKNWSGNGSGIFISKDGYIVTNHHVIENAKDIEVEFTNDKEVKAYSAEIIKTDEPNDLAIIKINDSKFEDLKELKYNFFTRSVDVGTEVFALGYPMALDIMGKDIKFTDGKISSKTGFQGDIRTYQSTTPIQPGNSGGPLFDHNGNLLGINSSGLGKDIVDNVGYTIKSNYIINLIDVLPKSMELPSDASIKSKPLTEQVKILSNYVVLIKVSL